MCYANSSVSDHDKAVNSSLEDERNMVELNQKRKQLVEDVDELLDKSMPDLAFMFQVSLINLDREQKEHAKARRGVNKLRGIVKDYIVDPSDVEFLYSQDRVSVMEAWDEVNEVENATYSKERVVELAQMNHELVSDNMMW